MADITISLCSADRWFLIPPIIYKFGDLQNLYPDLDVKLHIIDDTTSYDYEDYLRPLCDANPSISISKNTGKKGLAGARNYALDNCTTKFWTFIDDDDWLDSSYFDFLERCLRNPNDSYFIGLSKRRCDKIKKSISVVQSRESILVSVRKLFDLGFTPPVSYQVFKVHTLSDLRYEESIKSGIDHDLWVSLYFKSHNEIINVLSVQEEAKNYYDGGDRITKNIEKRRRDINDTISVWCEKFGKNDDGLLPWLRKEYQRSLNHQKMLASLKSPIFLSVYYYFTKLRNKNRIFKFQKR